ncbi:MAG: SAM-dependent methyltransferase, partial [Coxiellaceae bacterium]|nr:SAM-dependent methyltransferase [Coxiellaceae bacterium]
HFRHHSHDNPLIHVGIQDITAHVDFSAVGHAAEEAGFTVESFTTQAHFLLSHGLLDIAERLHSLETSQQVKTLTMPTEMGEMFKVMILSK